MLFFVIDDIGRFVAREGRLNVNDDATVFRIFGISDGSHHAM